MNPPHRDVLGALAAATIACAPCASAQPDVRTWEDPAGDAVVRKTDTGCDGPIPSTIPDLVRASIMGWAPYSPATDPYAGEVVDEDVADMFRLDVVFKGFLCPPGPLGLGGEPYDPLRYGPSPVYGFLDLDVDEDKDTGGELGGAAELRYLANVARFGRRPYGSLGERIAVWEKDHDGDFGTGPQFERSGADFALVLCGCTKLTIVNEGGDGDGVFDPGETWIVRGRFFQRAAGYQGASSAYGGSSLGLYDPQVNVRFSHDPGAGTTTLSLVYALNMTGAGLLAGKTAEAIDHSVSNQTSVVEGLQDVIEGAEGSLSGPTYELAHRWRGRDPYQFLRCTRWEATAIFATAYTGEQDSLYVYTDTGFAETPEDMDGDGSAGPSDVAVIAATIAALDGGPDDGDGVKNGSVFVKDYGPNFHLCDVNCDWYIDSIDEGGSCPADFNGDGKLTINDFIAFQAAWRRHDPRADFNHDGQFTINDFITFQAAFARGC